MKISIITAVWNNVELLKSAVTSVSEQIGVDYEHIVIDGGSTDGTFQYIESLYNPKIKFYSEKDKGIYDALNKGLRHSSNEIVGLLHSDDVYANNEVLSKVHQLFAEGADVVYSDLCYVNRDDTSKVFRFWKSGVFNPDQLLFGWMPPHPTVFFRRSLLDQVGEFNLQYKISSDYCFLLKLFSLSGIDIRYLNEVTVLMRVGGVSNRGLKNILRKSFEDYSILKGLSYSPLGTVLLKNLRKLNQLKLLS